jgi:hypothetical protein
MSATEGTTIHKTITDSTSKELGNKPPRFNGDRDKFKHFLFKVTCYLRFHQKSIETDEERILFVITHLTDGAALWAETWIAGRKLNTDGLPDLGKYEDFTLGARLTGFFTGFGEYIEKYFSRSS